MNVKFRPRYYYVRCHFHNFLMNSIYENVQVVAQIYFELRQKPTTL